MLSNAFKSLLALTLLLSLMNCASATYIQLTSNLGIESIVTGNSTIINVSIRNTGDEPAYNVQLTLRTPEGFETNDIYIGVLQPNTPYTGSFNVTISGALPGRYPLTLVTHYTDANSYPFSTTTASFMIYETVTPINIYGSMGSTEIQVDGSSEVTLSVRNMDSRPHELDLKFNLPDELSVDRMGDKVQLSPKGEKTLTFKVSSFGALAGSTYPIFTTLSYDEDGLHYSSIASGVIKIVEKKSAFSMPSWLPIAAIAVLVLAFVYMQTKKRKREE